MMLVTAVVVAMMGKCETIAHLIFFKNETAPPPQNSDVKWMLLSVHSSVNRRPEQVTIAYSEIIEV